MYVFLANSQLQILGTQIQIRIYEQIQIQVTQIQIQIYAQMQILVTQIDQIYNQFQWQEI